MRSIPANVGLVLATFLAAHGVANNGVERHIERLRSSAFAEREDAVRALVAAGERSVGAVKSAACDDDLEVRSRALRVLASLAISPLESAAHAAENALAELAKADKVLLAKEAADSLRAVHAFRQEQKQERLAALRKLGGTALLNESGDVYRIDFEGQYITDEGLLAQQKLPATDLLAKEEFAAKYVVTTRVTDDDLALLKFFPALTYLNLQRTQASDAGLVHLKSLRKLEYLAVNEWTTDEGLIHLAGLVHLKSLSLPQSQVTGVGFARLTGLSSLEEVDLTNSQATDAGLAEIAGHSGLQTLRLGATRVTDKGLRELERLPKLSSLTLHRTAVSDAGIRRLHILDELSTLTLDHTKITDEGIQLLAGLKRLRAVSFTQPLVSEAGVVRLRTAAPQANIHLWP